LFSSCSLVYLSSLSTVVYSYLCASISSHHRHPRGRSQDLCTCASLYVWKWFYNEWEGISELGWSIMGTHNNSYQHYSVCNACM